MKCWAIPAAAVAMAVGGAGSVAADEFDPAHVSADANWLMHMDLEALREQPTFQHFRQKWEGRRGEWMERRLSRFGLDKGQVRGVTMYGLRGHKPGRGVVLSHVEADRDEVLVVWKHNAESKVGEHEGVAIHRWQRPGFKHRGGEDHRRKGRRFRHRGPQQVFSAFPDGGTVLISRSRDRLTAALDVWAGRADSLDDNGSVLTADAPNDALIYAELAPSAEGAEHGPNWLKHVARARMSIEPDAGDEELTAQLHVGVDDSADDGQLAEHVRNVLTGFRSMTALKLDDHPAAQKVLSRIEIGGGDETVTAELTATHEELIEAMEALRQLQREHHRKMKRFHDRPRHRRPGGRGRGPDGDES